MVSTRPTEYYEFRLICAKYGHITPLKFSINSIMYFHRFVSLIIAIHHIVYAHSEIDNLNPPDGRDLETSLFTGNIDNDFLTADAINQVSSCVGPEDHLSSSISNSDIFLFARDPEHEECLPPVNIGADVLNLWKDPVSELERQILNDKTPGATGPGPEEPKPPAHILLYDPDDGDDMFRIPDEEGWVDYEGPVYDEHGWRIDSYGSERRVEDEEEENNVDEDDDDEDPCAVSYGPKGFEWDLCCDGPAYRSTTPGTVWEYDAVESCDWSKLFLHRNGSSTYSTDIMTNPFLF